MQLEIKPEPSPQERTAIERALAREAKANPSLSSAWREVGVRENTEPDARDEAQAGALPRSRPGATRA